MNLTLNIKPTITSRSLINILCLILLFSPQHILAQATLVKQANAAFETKKYKKALNLYRKYLRKKPKDYPIWNLLGASYYHNGQPRQALKALKKVRKKLASKSLNYFYQGIAYDAIDQEELAIKALKNSIAVKDKSSSLAALELIGIYYDKRDFSAAKKSINQFKKDFPRSPFIKRLIETERNIAKRVYSPIKETQRNRLKAEIFQKHRLSFTERPHFWYFQTGFDYTVGKRSNPAFRGEPVVATGAGFEETYLQLAAGFGLGPFYSDQIETMVGYNYTQQWFTNNERIEVYFDDPTDFTYFPFRPDLQEREHKVYVELKTNVNKNIETGIYGDFRILRSGSSIYPAPERPEVRKVTTISQSNNLTPWIRWNIDQKHSLYSYIYLNKTVNLEQSEFSRQTYAIFSSSTDPFISFSIGHQWSLFGDKLLWDNRVYSYQYLTNDFWEEYQRTGFSSRVSFDIFSEWTLTAGLAYYQDSYLFDQIKIGSCEFGQSFSEVGVTCPRTDTGIQLIGGLSYQPEKTHKYTVQGYYQSHKNPELKVYDEERSEILFLYTLAFPSADVIGRYLGDFADSISIKREY